VSTSNIKTVGTESKKLSLYGQTDEKGYTSRIPPLIEYSPGCPTKSTGPYPSAIKNSKQTSNTTPSLKTRPPPAPDPTTGTESPSFEQTIVLIFSTPAEKPSLARRKNNFC
jgi:hypothetical protein